MSDRFKWVPPSGNVTGIFLILVLIVVIVAVLVCTAMAVSGQRFTCSCEEGCFKNTSQTELPFGAGGSE